MIVKRLLVIVLVILVLAAGAGVGVWLLAPGLIGLGKAPEPPPAAEPVPPPEPPKPVFVSMKTIDIPVVVNGALNRMVHVNLVLVVPAEEKDAVTEAIPRLRDAFIRKASAFFPKELEESGKISPRRVKDVFFDEAAKILGKAKLKDLLVQGYFEM